MKKIIELTVCMIFTLFLFAACGATPPPAPETKPQPVVEDEPEPVPEPVQTEVSVVKYTVAAGDTLSQIALKFYGTRAKAYYFPIIMSMNPGIIKHPDKLTPKMVLDIPNYEEFMANSEYKEKSKPDFQHCIDIYKKEGRDGVAESLQRRLREL